VHSAAEAEKAYQVGRETGFDNINLDFIFGVPGSPWSHWLDSLERIVALAPEHVSTYGLTIEEGTVLAERLRQGRWKPVDEEMDARVYEEAVARLTEAGYEHYEVSNFARPARRSRHNWACWMGEEYVGVGLSAHSFLGGVRRWNKRGLQEYIEAVEQGGAPGAGCETIDVSTAFRERLWMGLRTCAGVELSLEQGLALAGHHRFKELEEEDYVELAGITLRLTPRGFALADALGIELLDLLEGDRASVSGQKAACNKE
jgi:oxygen-independent coproporphyrinogen-3 oxidase